MRRRSARVMLEHGAAQSVSQILGFVNGILVVRALDKADYAQYSVVIAVIAAAAVIADSGISSTVMAIGGRIHGDRAAMSALFSRAFRVRYLFGFPVIIIACGWAAVLLLQNGLAWDGTALLLSVTAFTLFPTFAAGLLRAYFRLRLRARFMQSVDIGAALLRLAVIGLGMWWGAISAAYLLVGGLVVAAAILIAFWIGAGASEMVRSEPTSNGREFWAGIRRVLPMTIFLVASEQALLAIASFRGNPEIVAEMAALSRFAVAFVVLNAVVSDIVAPRFSRAANHFLHLRRLMIQVFCGYLAIVVVFVALVWVAAPLLLALLGPGYAGLTGPLVLFAAGYGLANLAQAMNVIGQARGWVQWSWLYVPLSIIAISVCIFVLPLQSVSDVAVMFVLQCTPAVLTQIVRIVTGLSRAKNEPHEVVST
ncbi:oligosaccharide flippase family protein [Microbacterium sp. CFBP 13617]|uniref:oligosaccharide flippase family protein n=1 Tax=Microbacterium sp. CFBP 13617 TaxID=2774035 RepID=UPI002017BCC4|nr:oligosaccharide flippase family protein [Microbacterium sp. CFBP 13617]